VSHIRSYAETPLRSLYCRYRQGDIGTVTLLPAYGMQAATMTESRIANAGNQRRISLNFAQRPYRTRAKHDKDGKNFQYRLPS
ncbi:MAG: hypothetical protein ABF515_06915, partial [Bifidobacterium sp.]